jgi:hypothetical protein
LSPQRKGCRPIREKETQRAADKADTKRAG